MVLSKTFNPFLEMQKQFDKKKTNQNLTNFCSKTFIVGNFEKKNHYWQLREKFFNFLGVYRKFFLENK